MDWWWLSANIRSFFPPLLSSGAAYFAQRHLFNSPNVHVSGEARKMSIKPEAEHKEVARRFTQHRESLAKLAPGYTGKAQ